MDYEQIDSSLFSDPTEALASLNELAFVDQIDPNVRVNVVDGAGTLCPDTNRWIKWRIPSYNGPDGQGPSLNATWEVSLAIVHFVLLGQVSACVQLLRSDELVDVVIQHQGSSIPNECVFEDRFIIYLDTIINDYPLDGTLFKLFLFFEQLPCSYEVCEFEIKDFHMEKNLVGEDCNESDPIREKKQMATGKYKTRLQRLDRKFLDFSLCTNAPVNRDSIRGFIRRFNSHAMIGKEKAVDGETEIPVEFIKETKLRSSNDSLNVSYCYYFKTDLDPDQFYDDNPGKELYTSDKTCSENNVFVFDAHVHVDGQMAKKEIYRFRTKSKEYSSKLMKVIELEANRAHIKHLTIEKMSTKYGDIAYTWQLMNVDTAGTYEEGDVVGIFPDPVHGNEKTYVDLLTPMNYRDATLAGVITRSYYLSANSQEDEEGGRACEKICMVGKIKIKVSGPVKHGDFIFASNKLPGIAVTEDQLIADKGNWRKKRLLGYSIETNPKPGVKLVTCIVSILLSINNDQVEVLLSKLETSLSEEIDEKLNKIRDDVDIQIGGINEIVNSTHTEVTSRKNASFRRNCRVCLFLLLFFIFGILACYVFLSPGSPYNKWRCRRGSLSGTLSFEIEDRHDEEIITMKGVLYNWVTLQHKLDLQFDKKENFTGSYYINLRKCENENLRKVLGWFSNPPVYYRAQVFAATCDCRTVYHYQKYHMWKRYKKIFGKPTCEGQRGPHCNKTSLWNHRRPNV